MNHTDKPLNKKNQFYLYFPDDPWAAFNANACKTVTAPDVQTHQENVRRLQACWNLCLGVSTDTVEQTKKLKDLVEDFNSMSKALEQAEVVIQNLEDRVNTAPQVPVAQPVPAGNHWQWGEQQFKDLKAGDRFICTPPSLSLSYEGRFLFVKIRIVPGQPKHLTAMRASDGLLVEVADTTPVMKII